MSDGFKYDFSIKTDMTKYALNQCKEQVKRALEKIGQKSVDYAKLACPVDTGRLRSSITHAVGDNEVIVGTNVEYAIYVELGARGRRPVYYLKNSMAKQSKKEPYLLSEEQLKKISLSLTRGERIELTAQKDGKVIIRTVVRKKI